MMFPQTAFRPDPHLCFAQSDPCADAPHPRNAATLCRLKKAFESYSLAKICARQRARHV